MRVCKVTQTFCTGGLDQYPATCTWQWHISIPGRFIINGSAPLPTSGSNKNPGVLSSTSVAEKQFPGQMFY